jgi:SNF2 family DNA or RNA helicase
MQIVDNRGLLLRVRNPDKITTAIPSSQQVSNTDVLVRWGVDEATVLKNLNVRNVPSPILGKSKYDWPGRYKPFEHQKTTASFLTMNRRSFCFNEQGTGKTASAIWASDFLMQENLIKRVLIICPLSIMDSAWRSDLFNFAMHRTVDIAHGPKKKRQTIINGDAEYMIINYDGVEIVKDDIANGGFDLIIVDEATHYKNAQSKRWKVLASIVKPETWLWLMTGTPAAQSPIDAYGLAKLVNPKSVPRFFGSFRESVMQKISQFKWVPKPNATETVFNALQPAIRFTKEQCLDLPEMTYVKREVELTPQQKKYYDILRKQMMATADGEQITAANAAVNMNKLLQISCGAVYTDSGETIEFDIKNRYKVLKEVINESSQKVLIFVPFKHVIELLKEKLFKDGISNAVISGGVSANRRTEIFKAFQTTDTPRVLIIQPQAAAHGVTLTAANTIVWWGPTASLETYAQANARVHRSGQKHPCTVVQLQGPPVEKRMYRMLDERINVHTQIIDLYKDVLEL